MPKAKRNQNITLTKTAKKDISHKKQVIEAVRKYCTTDYDHVFVVGVNNMRNVKLKALREQWKSSSRFVFGKNKLLQHALGRSPADECADQAHKITPYLAGQCGLLFTSLPAVEIEQFFENYNDYDYARTGDVASDTVELEAGPLLQFAHSIEPHLRTKLNLPVALKRGVVTLERNHTVCKSGDKLTTEQAQVLKLLEMPQVKFQITLLCRWSKKADNGGEFEAYQKAPASSKKLKIAEGKHKKELRKSRKRASGYEAEQEAKATKLKEKSKKTISKKASKMALERREKKSSGKEGKFRQKKTKRATIKSIDADAAEPMEE